MNDQKRAKAVAKIFSGIEGFDDLTVGGLPRGRTTLLMGGPGSGKTVFALQVLVNGATRRGAPGIFVAFEENADLVRENAESFGWDIVALQKTSMAVREIRVVKYRGSVHVLNEVPFVICADGIEVDAAAPVSAPSRIR